MNTYIDCGILISWQVEALIKEYQFLYEDITYLKTRVSLFEHRFTVKGVGAGKGFKELCKALEQIDRTLNTGR